MKNPRLFLGALVLFGFLWRLLVNWRMEMPREDGVNYLWMAARFADGAIGEALSEVFSPLLALVIAVPVALGIEPFGAGQLALAAVGACTVFPVAAISERLFPGTLWIAGLLVFVAHRPMMLGAEIYTEPLFLLVGSCAFLAGLAGMPLLCGGLSGLAFWVRPEAALIPLVFLTRTNRSWLALLPLGAGVALLAVWRGMYGHGFDPVPKLAFIAAHNVAGETNLFGFVLRSLWHFLLVPGELVSAFGLISFLALVGVARQRPCRVLWLFGLATLVICLYVPRWRFFVNWMFLVVPLAAVGVQRLPRPRWWVAVAMGSGLVWSLIGGVANNRIAEREVAEYLRERLEPGERVAGDMTRVHYYAGQRPLAPRHFEAEELIAAGRVARFVVLRARRSTTPSVVAGLPEYQEKQLPVHLQALAAERGMLILERIR